MHCIFITLQRQNSLTCIRVKYETVAIPHFSKIDIIHSVQQYNHIVI
jgi:hypothetical protein